jgi:hypothetical protein
MHQQQPSLSVLLTAAELLQSTACLAKRMASHGPHDCGQNKNTTPSLSWLFTNSILCFQNIRWKAVLIDIRQRNRIGSTLAFEFILKSGCWEWYVRASGLKISVQVGASRTL